MKYILLHVTSKKKFSLKKYLNLFLTTPIISWKMPVILLYYFSWVAASSHSVLLHHCTCGSAWPLAMRRWWSILYSILFYALHYLFYLSKLAMGFNKIKKILKVKKARNLHKIYQNSKRNKSLARVSDVLCSRCNK